MNWGFPKPVGLPAVCTVNLEDVGQSLLEVVSCRLPLRRGLNKIQQKKADKGHT